MRSSYKDQSVCSNCTGTNVWETSFPAASLRTSLRDAFGLSLVRVGTFQTCDVVVFGRPVAIATHAFPFAIRYSRSRLATDAFVVFNAQLTVVTEPKGNLSPASGLANSTAGMIVKFTSETSSLRKTCWRPLASTFTKAFTAGSFTGETSQS
ncbi:MAG: hypothetical protein GY799_26280 [Desulfobulbaceae bacterium]|nr:hypothetical protein [Desulfobulbaceae bacterium]